MRRRLLLAVSIAVLICSTARVIAQDHQHTAAAQPRATDPSRHASCNNGSSSATRQSARDSSPASSDTVHSNALDTRAMRVEGEKRFHANCGRCHLAPHKFPPRAMATIIRHMRVRALITDEDMKYILSYMTQ
jgi:hypothetical protein